VLAKLAEVLFIEVLRQYMNEQGEGRTGWLAGVGALCGFESKLSAMPQYAMAQEGSAFSVSSKISLACAYQNEC